MALAAMVRLREGSRSEAAGSRRWAARRRSSPRMMAGTVRSDSRGSEMVVGAVEAVRSKRRARAVMRSAACAWRSAARATRAW